jgi:hypothetical protein
MSKAKEELARKEALNDALRTLLVSVRAIEECEHHDGVFYSVNNQDAESTAYACATAAHKRGELDGSLDEVRTAIKQVIEDAGPDCPLCQR